MSGPSADDQSGESREPSDGARQAARAGFYKSESVTGLVPGRFRLSETPSPVRGVLR